MSKLEDRTKIRKLQQLEGIILALKSQMQTTYKELKKFRDDNEYNYDEVSDSEKEAMDRVEKMLEEIDYIWNYKMV